MKAIEYINNKQKRAVWLRAFHIWQRRPHELAPLSEESRTCSSCGTVYQGNFCPRCGQSARVGRFSFKKAALLFLDVWGMGNRSMFRSIRDLMLRPGFMIRDYLSGMQSAYFPPFKMFFLLAAFSLVVEHGFNFGLDVKDVQDEAPKTEQTAMENTKIARHDLTVHPGDKEEDIKWKAVGNASLRFVKVMDALREKNPAIFSLLSLVLFSVPLFFFLRSSPTIPDLRYSEFIVALVYTSNMYSIYSIAGNLLDSSILKIIAVLMIFVALKQFSGFSKLRVLRYIVLTTLISIFVMVLIGGVGVSFIYLFA
jgi:hypothetical protein